MKSARINSTQTLQGLLGVWVPTYSSSGNSSFSSALLHAKPIARTEEPTLSNCTQVRGVFAAGWVIPSPWATVGTTQCACSLLRISPRVFSHALHNLLERAKERYIMSNTLGCRNRWQMLWLD